LYIGTVSSGFVVVVVVVVETSLASAWLCKPMSADHRGVAAARFPGAAAAFVILWRFATRRLQIAEGKLRSLALRLCAWFFGVLPQKNRQRVE